MTKLTPSITAAIASAVRRGATLTKAAKALGVSQRCVRDWLSRGMPEVAAGAATTSYGAFAKAVTDARAAFLKSLLQTVDAASSHHADGAKVSRALQLLKSRYPDQFADRRRGARALQRRGLQIDPDHGA